MNVIVVGLGDTGLHIARVLSLEGHDVTIVDSNPERIARAEESMDVMALKGHGAALKTLRNSNADRADLLIAVTNSDEINVLAATTARRLGTKRVVARVSSSHYLEQGELVSKADLLGIDLIISQQTLAAMEIQRLVKSFGAIAVEMYLDNQVEMVQLPVGPDLPIVEKPIRELEFPGNSMLAGVLRKEQIIVPTGVDTLLVGDEVFLIARLDDVPRVEKMFGKVGERSARKVTIVGGGEIGLSVARLLISDGIQVALIDNDADRCRLLSELLKEAVVINGDGTNLTLLQEERVWTSDVFAAVSGYDDTNLMSTLLARHLGVKRTVCLASRSDYVPIYDALGISATVSPRLATANRILKYVRHGETVSVTVLEGGKAEILELIPSEGSAIAEKRVRDIELPHGSLIVAVNTDEGPVVPRKGTEVVRAGQTVIVFSTPKARAAVERLFRRRLLSLG